MKSVILYLIFCFLSFVINYGVFYFLYNIIFDTNFLLFSNLVAFILSTTFAFITIKNYVFKSKTDTKEDLFREVRHFFEARIFSFLVEEVGLLLVEKRVYRKSILILGMSIQTMSIAKILLSMLGFIINFLLSKFLVFK